MANWQPNSSVTVQSVMPACAALGLSESRGPGSLELAMIRAGHAPGTFTVKHGLGYTGRSSASGRSSA